MNRIKELIEKNQLVEKGSELIITPSLEGRVLEIPQESHYKKIVVRKSIELIFRDGAKVDLIEVDLPTNSKFVLEGSFDKGEIVFNNKVQLYYQSKRGTGILEGAVGG